MTDAAEPLEIPVAPDLDVSALWLAPPRPMAALVLAHGAGAGMDHSFMQALANGLAQRGVATLRYQFPFVERGSKRPDAPPLAQATVRAAVTAARQRAPQLPLFAGGKSFGGRMTSQAQAAAALDGVRGIVFFGFPLHPAKQPSTERARHLLQLRCPLLFLQGTRDALADIDLLRSLQARLDATAQFVFIDGADHAFHVPARSGRTDAQVLSELLDAAANWMGATRA